MAIYAVAAGLALSAPAVASGTGDQAASFINGLATKVLQTVNDPQLSPAQQQQRIHALADQGFDVPAIARFVLGSHWRMANPGERTEFTRVFEDYMVQFYTGRFEQYKDVKFQVTGMTPKGNDTTLVHSEILQPGGKPPAKVDWWITGTNGTYKIVDVSIEGVSELITYRDEFGSLLDRNGGNVSALIAQLRSKTHV